MTIDLEFTTVLGSMKSPFAMGSFFVARFGSEYVIKELNELGQKHFYSKMVWEPCFGKKVYGKTVSWDLLKTKKVITSSTIKRFDEQFSKCKNASEKFTVINEILEEYNFTEYELTRLL